MRLVVYVESTLERVFYDHEVCEALLQRGSPDGQDGQGQGGVGRRTGHVLWSHGSDVVLISDSIYIK